MKDDPATRQITRRILATHGFEVVGAGHGIEALEWLARSARTPGPT